MEKGLVSVVIPTIKGREYLAECIPSLFGQSYGLPEVIIVDNGSSDGTPEYVRKNFPGVRVIENKINLGFSKAVNIGIRASSGEYVFILNDDTLLDPGCIKRLAEQMRADSRIGMCCPKILSYFDHTLIDNVGHLVYPDGMNFSRGRGEVDRGQYDQVEEICFPPGCAAFCRRKMLDEIGLLDENLFMFGDDTELGFRARLAGWICMYVPAALMYHRWSSTAGKYSTFKAFSVEKNRVWVAVSIFPLSLLVRAPVYTFLRYIFQACSVFSKKGYAGNFVKDLSKTELLKVLLRANLAALASLPENLRRRAHVQRLKKVSNAEIYSWFRRFGISARQIAFCGQ